MLLRVILLLILFFTSLLQRIEAAEIGMHGTLIVISCTINNDSPMNISFGDAVGIRKVDGERYRQPIPIEIQCTRAPGNLLNMIFVGTATDFENTALATQNPDLGIRLLRDEVPIEINKEIPLELENIPSFYAVPVKRPLSELSSGEFNAIVTLGIVLE